jgi:hypothetical protein
MKNKRTFRYEEIAINRISASDLREEASNLQHFTCLLRHLAM